MSLNEEMLFVAMVGFGIFLLFVFIVDRYSNRQRK
jgi:hypothetical protein